MEKVCSLSRYEKAKIILNIREHGLCQYVWITCLSYCATEVLILDKSCGAKWLRHWNFTQATAEDPGRQDEDDAGHLEKMTDYKSYCKVCVSLKNGFILPTGQEYAPSAVINDALSRTVLHCLELSCTVLHSLALSCTVLHCLVLSCTVLHCLALSCTV